MTIKRLPVLACVVILLQALPLIAMVGVVVFWRDLGFIAAMLLVVAAAVCRRVGFMILERKMPPDGNAPV